MPAFTADRQTAVVSELRTHVDRFDALPYDVQQSLIKGALSRPVPADAPQDRDALVQAKFKELLRAKGVDPDHPETWRSTDYEARYAAMEQAERETPGYVAPTPQVDEFAIDGDPEAALAQARQEAIDAAIERSRANTACAMAQQRIMRCDQEIANYADLDDQVASWLVEQLKAGEDHSELPYHLDSAQRDRSRCLDRREIAHAASLRLQSEARLAESNQGLAERRVKAIATLIVNRQAEALAEERRALDAKILAIDEELASLPIAYLPGSSGQPSALPPAVIRAITEPRVAPKQRPELVEQWRTRHADLVAGTGA